jgi:hypothetical protein
MIRVRIRVRVRARVRARGRGRVLRRGIGIGLGLENRGDRKSGMLITCVFHIGRFINGEIRKEQKVHYGMN